MATIVTPTRPVHREPALAEPAPAEPAPRGGATDPARDPLVDTLRAMSTVAVVVGHALVIGFWRKNGSIAGGNLLETVPGFRPLTWLFQVVPLFFVLAGYANAAMWAKASAEARRPATWITKRLRPIAQALVPVVAIGAVVAIAGSLLGGGDIVRQGLWLASIQIWFLAVFVIVTALSPIALKASTPIVRQVVALFTAAFVVDMTQFFAFKPIAFANYVFVWMACHQIGVAWQRGALHARRETQALRALMVFGTMVVAVAGPYVLSLVDIEGRARSNNYPPTVTLALIALGHTFGALALREYIERLSAHRIAGRVLVAVSANGMSIYLWHLAAIAGAGLVAVQLPIASLAPGSIAWWATRPLALGILALFLVPMMAVLGKPERRMMTAPKSNRSAIAPVSMARCMVTVVSVFVAAFQLCNWGMVEGSHLLNVRWQVIGCLAVALMVSAPSSK